MSYGDQDGRTDRRRFAEASNFCEYLDRKANEQGLEFRGLSVRYAPYEVFMVLRFENPEGKYVQFVSSSDLAAAMAKAVGQIGAEGLKLKPDQY